MTKTHPANKYHTAPLLDSEDLKDINKQTAIGKASSAILSPVGLIVGGLVGGLASGLDQGVSEAVNKEF